MEQDCQSGKDLWSEGVLEFFFPERICAKGGSGEDECVRTDPDAEHSHNGRGQDLGVERTGKRIHLSLYTPHLQYSLN